MSLYRFFKKNAASMWMHDLIPKGSISITITSLMVRTNLTNTIVIV